jgi:hypothetical protein
LLENLKKLNLQGNKLSGGIPGSFEKLKKLVTLSLSKNKLAGELPVWVLQMKHHGVNVDLRENKGFSLPAQAEKMCHGRKEVDLSNLSLEGEVPGFIGDLKTLGALNMSGNNFNVCVPSWRNLKALTHVTFDGSFVTQGCLDELAIVSPGLLITVPSWSDVAQGAPAFLDTLKECRASGLSADVDDAMLADALDYKHGSVAGVASFFDKFGVTGTKVIGLSSLFAHILHLEVHCALSRRVVLSRNNWPLLLLLPSMLWRSRHQQ